MSAPVATRTTHAATAVLASLLTLAMVFGMNALAGHQYRVAVAAQAQPMMVAATQVVTIIGHRQI
jgi:succinate dehydrogenase hydrophobic anchor subunit